MVPSQRVWIASKTMWQREKPKTSILGGLRLGRKLYCPSNRGPVTLRTVPLACTQVSILLWSILLASTPLAPSDPLHFYYSDKQIQNPISTVSSFQNTCYSSIPGIPKAHHKPIIIFIKYKRNSSFLQQLSNDCLYGNPFWVTTISCP